MRNKIGWLAIRIILVCLFGWNTAALGVQAVAGDNAPLGGRDGVLNIADLLVMERFILGLATPTEEEFKVANVAPLGAPDNELNLGDLLVLQRAVLGLVTLPPVNLGPDAPLLNPDNCAVGANPCVVSGTAEINSIVHIYVNDVEQAPVPADASGVFTASVPLLDGDNSVYAITELDSEFSPASSTITVNYVNNISRTLSVSESTISQNTVWTPGIPAAPYYITAANLTINAGVQLLIQPGTEIRFGSGKSLIVNGSLVVNGSSSPVVFTRDAVSGTWAGINITNTVTNVIIDNADIAYATTGITITGTGVASNSTTVKNSVIHDNTQNGIKITNASPKITGNTVRNNVQAGISISTLSNPEITNNIIKDNTTNGINMLGTTTAGQYPQPVFNNNQFSGTTTNYVNTSNFVNSASVPVVDMTGTWWGTTDINTIAGKILDYTDNKTNHPVVDYSDYIDAANGVAVPGNYLNGVISSDKILTGGTTYQVLGDLVVKSGATLTIQSGASLQFGTGMDLTVNGSLIVNGTVASPVVFTSNKTPLIAGAWPGIVITNIATYVLIDNAEIAYAVTSIDIAGTGIASTSTTLRNSTIRNNSTYGIKITDASPQLTGNTVNNNPTGIYIYNQSNPTITGNIIKDNTTNGINLVGVVSTGKYPQPIINNNQFTGATTNYANTSAYVNSTFVPVVDMTGNWWGTTDVNAIAAKIADYMDSKTNHPVVDYSDYLDAANGEIIPGNYLNGSISSNTTLMSGKIYKVLGDVVVDNGVTLIIDAGAILQFGSGMDLIVNGSLIVNGTSVLPVRFFSNFPDMTAGNWPGITINNTATGVLINNAEIAYAINGITINSSNVVVQNSLVHDNSQGGIIITNASPQIILNIINNNSGAGLSISGLSISEVSENLITANNYGINLSALGGQYPQPQVHGNQIYGSLTNIDIYTGASGSSIVPIVNMTGNWWGTANINNIASNIQDFTDLDYYQQRTTNPVVDYRDYLDAPNGVPVLGNYLIGQITSNTTLSNLTYSVLGDLVVLPGITLTAEPGSVVQFGLGMDLEVNGSLQVTGLLNAPVVFEKGPSTDSWSGITLTNTAFNTLIDHADIAYSATGIIVKSSNTEIRNSIIHNNLNGIKIDNASPLITANTIQSNANIGLYLHGQTNSQVTDNKILFNSIGIYLGGTGTITFNPEIHGNKIYSNSSRNCTNSATYSGAVPVVNMTGNWWGTSDVSIIDNTIDDYTDSIKNNRMIIDYSGFYHDEAGSVIDARQFLYFASTPVVDFVISAGNYLVADDINVPNGTKLTIEAGAELEFLWGRGIYVHGSLDINGVHDNWVSLSAASKDLATNWQGIRIYSDADQADIDYANINYANNGVYFDNISGNIRNSVLEYNKRAIFLNGNSQPLIDHNVIVGNTGGIYFNGAITDPFPIITNNDINNNTSDNLYLNNIDSSTVFNMSNNWFGTTDTAVIQSMFNQTNSNVVTSVPLANIASQENSALIPYNVVLNQKYISPAISAGIQDSVSITADFSHSSNWSVDVRNENAQIIRSFSGTGVQININWDGRDSSSLFVPDGRYTLVSRTSGTDSSVLGVVWVDNTAPQPELHSPVNNDIFTISKVHIAGITKDMNPAMYTLEVADGLTPLETDYRVITNVSNMTNLNKMNVSFDWLLNSEIDSNGDKTIRLTATDAAGNFAKEITRISVYYQSITNVTKNTTSIRPTQDEQLSVSFDLGAPATVYLRIYPDAGPDFATLVAEVSQEFTTGGHKTMTWNGMGRDNVYLPDEAYRFYLAAVVGGTTTNYTGSPGSPLPLELTVITTDHINMNAMKNKYLKASYTMSAAYGPVRIWFGPANNPNVTEQLTRVEDTPGAYTYIWDGRDLDNKLLDTTVNVVTFGSVTPLNYNSVIIKDNSPIITGTEVAPNIEVMSTPYIVLHSYDQISQVVYHVSQDSMVTVRLLKPCLSSYLCSINHDDPEGITLIDNEYQEANSGGIPVDHEFEWRGYDFNAAQIDSNNILVSQEGAYTFSIKATSIATGISTIYRGVLQLYQ